MPLRVYAIVGRPNRRALEALSRGRLRAIKSGALAAFVEECRTTPATSARALRHHDAVVRRIARHVAAVLPARFGTVVQSEQTLAALLKSWSKDLRQALSLVERQEQMTLRVFSNRVVVAPRTPPGDERAAAHPGTSYLRRRARAQSAPGAPEIEPLRAALAPLVSAERIVRHDRGPLVLTAYHLIPRGRARSYRQVLRRYASVAGSRAVASGPWPPYAFVPELRR